jgi:hypothetical protein
LGDYAETAQITGSEVVANIQRQEQPLSMNQERAQKTMNTKGNPKEKIVEEFWHLD